MEHDTLVTPAGSGPLFVEDLHPSPAGRVPEPQSSVQAALTLDIPVVGLDLESTGTELGSAKIVQLSLARVSPVGLRESFTTYVNPGMPIPPAATAVHRTTDEMVACAPAFKDIADRVGAFIGEAAIVGFGVAHFDIPLLERELEEAGVDLDLSGRSVIDVKMLYHRLRPRRLVDAYRDFCGGELQEAHDAGADVLAALDVLAAMLVRHPELPQAVEPLAALLRDPSRVDPQGKFNWDNGEATFTFSKHQGKTLREVARTDPDFLAWMLTRGFSPGVRRIVRRALRGEFPVAPNVAPVLGGSRD